MHFCQFVQILRNGLFHVLLTLFSVCHLILFYFYGFYEFMEFFLRRFWWWLPFLSWMKVHFVFSLEHLFCHPWLLNSFISCTPLLFLHSYSNISFSLSDIVMSPSTSYFVDSFSAIFGNHVANKLSWRFHILRSSVSRILDQKESKLL